MDTQLELSDFSDACIERALLDLAKKIRKNKYRLRVQYRGREDQVEKQALKKETAGLIRRYNCLADYLGWAHFWNIGGK
jgi:hypothetical protein